MSSIRGEALVPLFDAIHAGAACPDGWTTAFEAIARAIGAAAAGILVVDLPEGRARVLHGPPGLPDPPAALLRPEPAAPPPAGTALHLVLRRDAHRLVLLAARRPAGAGPFPDAAGALLARLVPALAQTLALAEAQAGEARLRAALDAVAGAILFAGPEAEVMHANRAGQAMLAAGVPLHLAGGRLAATGQAATAALRAAIRDAAAGRANGGPLPLPSPGAAPIAVHLLPLGGAAGGAAAALFLPDPAADPASGLRGLVAAYRLTGAEGALLALLLRGETMAGAALALGVAPCTARTHLSHLFAKTGTARQAELVALAARLTAPVRG
ncbi:hypothetical protein J5Y09_00770 [Roseomonas sp. PWR1]|uniref:HTH luxR-type domain-containing protein n=1 Tax=Roseomonas nitratireducens TaxID=2820810 RepID=A0ABS4AM51_9PROT|nr:hypothetical protein [Neoroseomonas nitratireducens]MBP0462429.1 hypothetical protein [Neoroseomonas nitratireducens]